MSGEPLSAPQMNLSSEFQGSHSRLALFRRYRWLPLVLPMVVFLVSGLAERWAEPLGLGYPLVYALRLLLTLAAVAFVWPYYRTVAFSCTWWAIPAGLVGGAVWIGICRLGIAETLLTPLGLSDWLQMESRAGFNPWEAFSGSTVALVAFLAVRFCGLVLVVPLIEEFFLRGFFMRFFERAEWWTLPLGTVTWLGASMATVYGVLSHPAEPIAAAVWFSLVTLLYARTGKIWDCVLVHAITNLTLGIYVLISGDWQLW